MVSVGGNLYSVPDGTRNGSVEVPRSPPRRCRSSRPATSSPPIRSWKAAASAASPRATAPSRRRATATPREDGAGPPPRRLARRRDAQRSLAIYEAVGRRLAAAGSRPDERHVSPATLDRIRRHLVGLRMPRALEVLEHFCCVSSSAAKSLALEAIDALLGEELTLREGRRIKAALQDGPAHPPAPGAKPRGGGQPIRRADLGSG